MRRAVSLTHYDLDAATPPGAASGARAEALFRQRRQEVYRESDQLFARLLPLEWLVLIVVALFVAPENWPGTGWPVHAPFLVALFAGGACTLLPVALVMKRPGAAVTRYTIAAAQMLHSALLIGLSGGRLETHFHVICSLVLLAIYRDWRILVAATSVVVLDHLFRGAYWPESLYGAQHAGLWQSLEHCAWVLFEDIFLAIFCLRVAEGMRIRAAHMAALEESRLANQSIMDSRLEAELALQKTNRQLESALQANQLIMDNSQDVICSLDAQGRFLSTNAACRDLWGYEAAELIGRCYLVLVHPEDRVRSRQLEETARADGKISDFVNRCLRKDGSEIDVLWSASWSAADEILFCVAHDVTEQQRIEKELRDAKQSADRANRAKSEFLSRMSHELRTPLNAILGFGQLLERQNPRPAQIPHLEHILKGGRHLLKLINEVLDISRIEADRMHLSLEPVNVNVALKEAAQLIEPLAHKHSVNVFPPAEAQTDWFVLADHQRLKQVLLNLLNNGVKYTPEGGSVTISCEARDETVRLVVRDTGIGIAPDRLARVFTPFDRLDVEGTGIEGTGLGLALSRRLVQAMRGQIGVESSPGEGSAFWVELERTTSPLQALSAEAIAPWRMPKKAAKARTVLYIEDNLSNLTLIQQLLCKDAGFDLLTAMQGRIGLDLARQQAPDLILLDLQLPDMPGWEVLAALQENENTRRIPTVVVSADATAGQLKRLLDAGARDYITKPIDVTQFYRVIEEAAGNGGNCVAA